MTYQDPIARRSGSRGWLAGSSLALGLLLLYGCGGSGAARDDLPAPRAEVPARNLLVIGLDGADWDIIDPLLERGELPNIARLVGEGARARLRTVAPILSPVVWTSAATGKLPVKHGIFDFLARAEDGSLVPVTSTLWRARSLWSILGDADVPVAVTAWWATWPAGPLPGYMATDRIAYQLFEDVIGNLDSADPAADAQGKTWPPELFAELAPRIVSPSEISDRELERFIDLEALGHPDGDDIERLNDLRTVVASTRTYEAIASKLLDKQPQGFHAVYNESTDTAAHLFMPFRPPARAAVDPHRAVAFGGVVDQVYREADAFVGRLLDLLACSRWNVLILSDHGFKHGGNRPGTDPRVGHGPAADWHDRFGILILWGPDIRRGVTVADATVLDVVPTILALYGLPLADDMDGRVLEEALEPSFVEGYPLASIPSYEREIGDSARAQPSSRDDDLLEKLRALGYIGGAPVDGIPALSGEPVAPGERFTQDSARAFNNRGVALLAQGDLDAAVEQFHKGLEHGGGVQSLVNLANVHLLRRDLDDAERALRRLETESPGLQSLPALEGRLADLRGDRVEAERLLREAIRINPVDARAHARLGHLMEEAGKLDDAVRHYRAAVRANPENAEAHSYLGNVLRMQGNLAGAENAYRDAVEADPKYPGGYNNLGLLLQEQGRLDEAVGLYRRGLGQAPKSALLHNSLGSLLILRDELEEAETEVREALALDAEMVEAWSNLGIVQALQGRTAEAGRSFERALELDPGSVDANFNLAKVLLLQREFERALERFARASELDPRHLEAALGAGQTAYRLGRHDAAIRHLEHARRIKPDIARLRRELGELYLERGDRRKAIEEWRESLRLSPDQPDLRGRLEDVANG